MKDENSFWRKDSKSTFVNAKRDWAEFDKVHLSFVAHTPYTPTQKTKQISHIEIAVNTGLKGGVCMASLVAAVISGELAKRRESSLAYQKSKGDKVPPPLFVFRGGGKSCDNNNEIEFREMSLSAGQRTDYVMQAMRCKGETDAEGKINPAKNIVETDKIRIAVGLTEADINAFAIQYLMFFKAASTPKARQTEAVKASTAPTEENAPCTAALPQAVSQRPTKVIVSYDEKGIMLVVATPDKFLAELSKESKKLAAANIPFVLKRNDVAPIIEAMKNGSEVFPNIALTNDEHEEILCIHTKYSLVE